jgi:hypothetical protein
LIETRLGTARDHSPALLDAFFDALFDIAFDASFDVRHGR